VKLSQLTFCPVFLSVLLFQIIVYSQELNQYSCSFTFASDPESTKVFINGEFFNVTPCKIDTLTPGTYQIAFELEGYERRETTEKLSENVYQRIFIQLEEIEAEIQKTSGSLKVTSEPTDATVLLDEKQLGTTPFNSDSIKIGSYTILLTKQNYFPFKQTINIEKNSPKVLNIKLISEETVRLKKKRNLKIFQNVRRIVFGSFGTLFLSIGAAKYKKKQSYIDTHQQAYEEYQEQNLSLQEYEKRYNNYVECVNNTNKLIKEYKNNFIISGIFGAGLLISIPF
jgi:hypothetical protein